ncbi:hypothetical protein LSAT2_009517 [Lamellibrachia satsuma]|nr:hypothetical protein LSAT2_009517 [Lamellibrachia satsuma]
MSDGLVCFLAVLVIVCVFSPDQIVSQCTTKYCDSADCEANVLTMVSRLQQQLAEQKETLDKLEEERIRDHRSIEQLQREITLIKEVQTATHTPTPRPRVYDCKDILNEGHTNSGTYEIFLNVSMKYITVYCDMETDGGGWLVGIHTHVR